MPRANLISLFADFAHYADDVAIVQRRGYRRESWTYGKLAQVGWGVANELRERGVRSGERVLIRGPNCAEWMAAFWGCLLRGAVAVPIDDGATPEFAARLAGETSAKLLIAAGDQPAIATQVRSKSGASADPGGMGAFGASAAAIPRLEFREIADTAAPPRVIGSHQVVGQAGTPRYESLADEPITRDHVAQILFTSGTTAEPRGVVLTHGNFLSNVEPLERGIDPYRKYEKWLHPLRFLTLVPMSHVFGQFMALFVPPLLGATIVFELSANPSEVVRASKRERTTALIAVPRMLDGLRAGLMRELEACGDGEWFGREFAAADGEKFIRRAWRFRRVHRWFGWKFWAFISGGAALTGETEEFFRRMGYAVVQGYGMTETASLVSLNHPFRAAQGTIGKVLPGREFKLAEDGEILVRGENVARGYWEAGTLRPSEQRGGNATAGEPTRAGWLRTGDIGEMDAQGNLRFRGRKKNVIVTPAGLNVYPEDLEAALRTQPGVRGCVVVPIERGGNAEPCAVLLPGTAVSKQGGYDDNADDAAMRDAVKAANSLLAEYQRVREWVVWPEVDFPRTATGKPRLRAIAARANELLSGTLGNGGRPSGRSRSLEDLIGRFAAPASASNAADVLENELNLSSLDRVELMSALEQRYQVELNETAFAQAKTIGDVERLVRGEGVPGRPPQHYSPALPGTRAGWRSDYVFPRWAQRAPVRWLRLAVYYALAWPATQILAHPKIVGRENLRGMRGPVLVVANHVTRLADVGFVLAALPARFRHRLATAIGGETLQGMRRPQREWFFARRWAYRSGYGLVIALFNVFPLPRLSGFRESFRFAGESVDRGYSVLVFPEGRSNDSETGEMASFQSGIGLLAENLRIPVLPMRIDGVWKMKRERRRLARPGEISVHIGKPVTFPAGTPPDSVACQLRSLVQDA
jgi:long-chain acyl-CoA synthetase